LETLTEREKRQSRNLISTFFSTPEIRAKYAKQMQFFEYGATHNERALFGGNRSGKTVGGCYEDTLHLTGEYPDWWVGKKFDHPVEWWVAGDTAKNVRDILQTQLCGKWGDRTALGTGMIPGDLILDTTVKHGLSDAFEAVFIKHVPSGGTSMLQFKSYDQGRTAFQGTSQHGIHLDEEPPLDIYTECLLRTMTVEGIILLTATPLSGLTDLMLNFLPELAPEPEKGDAQ
jgi:phage terminase large subunit-like protein